MSGVTPHDGAPGQGQADAPGVVHNGARDGVDHAGRAQSTFPPASSRPDSDDDGRREHDENMATFDRPMRDAPGPRRWAPMAIMAAGACGVAWAVSMALAGPAPPPRLASPAMEIEYSTGVEEAPEPRAPSPPRDGRDIQPVGASGAAGAQATDETRREAAERLAAERLAAQKLADARRHAPVVL
ncbi:MAG: hypothetical protein FD160_3904, partial [Caulobacteraceae bacterium]